VLRRGRLDLGEGDPVSLLELDHLRVRYGTGRSSLTAVDDVSLAVDPGTSIGIVGESGSGKSTLARAIVQLVPTASGRITLDGRDVTNARGSAVRHVRDRVQLVFQDPFASLNPRSTIGATLAEAVSLHERRQKSGADRQAQVDRLLDLVRLDASAAHRYPNEFSGGQIQRVAIARALAAGPRLLILDEVTSALDVSVQAAILNLLRDLRLRLGLTFICISHDLSVIGYLCEAVAVIYLGQVVETASCAELFSAPRHPYSRSLLDSIPQVRGDRMRATAGGDVPNPRFPPSGCRYHPRCAIGPLAQSGREICRSVDPHQDRMPESGRFAACHFPLGQPTGTADGSVSGACPVGGDKPGSLEAR
jgi:oligopeptide/dipeptide ABC transporter ATP-binding protein